MTSLPCCLILSRRPFLCAEPQTHAAYLTLARTRRRRGSSPARPLPGAAPPRSAALPGDGPPRRAGAARSTARGCEPRAPPPLESRHAPPLCGSSAAACRERSSNQAGSSTTAPPLRSPRGELSPPSAPVAASPATRGSVAARSYRPAAPRPAAPWFCRGGKGSVPLERERIR